MSYTALTYHIVFGTYRRKNVININHERELYKYMYDFATERQVLVRRIGGMPDHVHIICDIPAKLAVADFVKLLKSESSKFMKINPHFPYWERWASGYACLTVDAALRTARAQYVMNQKVHHAKLSFEDEFRDLLREAGIDSDSSILGD